MYIQNLSSELAFSGIVIKINITEDLPPSLPGRPASGRVYVASGKAGLYQPDPWALAIGAGETIFKHKRKWAVF